MPVVGNEREKLPRLETYTSYSLNKNFLFKKDTMTDWALIVFIMVYHINN